MRPFVPFATLLGAAFLLGCQEQASSPVGPEGLGVQLDKKTGDPPMHGDHGGDDGGDPLFNVTVSGDITGGPTEGTGAGKRQIVVTSFTLDVAFLAGKLTCGITGMKTGTFTLTKTAGNDPKRFEAFMNFQFTHKVNGNDIDHTLHLHGKIDKPEDWLPAVTNSITGDTGWTVTASGPNHPNGCTGEGEVGNDPIAWTGTVTRV